MYYTYIYTYIHICMYIKYIEGETTKTFLSLESWLYLRVLWQWPCCSGRRRPSYPLYNIHIYITYTIYKYTNSLYHYITLKIFRYTIKARRWMKSCRPIFLDLSNIDVYKYCKSTQYRFLIKRIHCRKVKLKHK